MDKELEKNEEDLDEPFEEDIPLEENEEQSK